MSATVKMLERRAGISGAFYEVGLNYTLDDATAAQFIHNRWATLVSGKLVQKDSVNANFYTNDAGQVIGLIDPNTNAPLTGFSMLKDKLSKAYIDQASKPYQSTFITAPTAWTSLQVVNQGEARASNGNWYIALTGGTCGANAPNLTNPLLTQPFSAWRDGAADGSSGGVPWVYFSKAQTVGVRDSETTAVAVTFSSISDARATQLITPISGSYGTPTDWQRATNQSDSNWFVGVGGGATTAIQAGISDVIKAPNASSISVRQSAGGSLALFATMGNLSLLNNVGGQNIYWEFNTDSLLLEIATEGWLAGRGIRVLIDNEEFSVGTLHTSIAGSNASIFTLVEITGKPKVRNIKIFNCPQIRSLRLTGNSALHYVKPQPLKMLFIGDSHWAGSGMSPAKQGMTWPTHIANLLGIKGVTNGAVGATGFLTTTGGGLTYNYLQRVSELPYAFQVANSIQWSEQSNQFDVVFLLATGNDNGADANYNTTVLATLQKVRELQPNALIVLHGAYFGNGGGTTAISDTNARAVFQQWNDANTLLIRTDSGALGGSWSTGTGRNASGQVVATGNTSFYLGTDGTHVNDAGVIYLAEKTVEHIYQELAF
jgi:lysophospholipase L1-like esterase